MTISLHATATPTRWPADAACDIALRFTLRNDGAAPIGLLPAVAQLGAISSIAGIGIAWQLRFGDAPIRELRTWYGPPGNPPSPQWVTSQSITIAPGGEHVSQLAACWIPNALLEPRHFALAAIDPEGMDNLVALGPLADCSVVVLRRTAAMLDRGKDDVLRGCVVAFVRPGTFELCVQYVQDSWLGVGERVHAEAPPIHITAG